MMVEGVLQDIFKHLEDGEALVLILFQILPHLMQDFRIFEEASHQVLDFEDAAFLFSFHEHIFVDQDHEASQCIDELSLK